MVADTEIATMLTTVDNPYDPFDQWDDWYAYDTRVGHHTTSYMARLTFNSNEISLPDQELTIELVIDEIVKLNPNGLYRKVQKRLPKDRD